MAWGSKILGRFRKQAASEVAYEQGITADETAAMRLENAEQQEETAAEGDTTKFEGGLLKEAALIREVSRLHASKYSVLKVLRGGRATRIRLSGARRILLTKLAIGGKRIAMAYGRLGKWGPGAGYNPNSQQNLALWLQEQGKEIALLENQLALQIQELREEAASAGPVVQKNKQIRDALKQYEALLLEEDRWLLDIATKKMAEINQAQQELRGERNALENARAGFVQQRTVQQRTGARR